MQAVHLAEEMTVAKTPWPLVSQTSSNAFLTRFRVVTYSASFQHAKRIQTATHTLTDQCVTRADADGEIRAGRCQRVANRSSCCQRASDFAYAFELDSRSSQARKKAAGPPAALTSFSSRKWDR